MFTTILIQPLANGLVLFYKVLGGNMGLAIIGFSLFLRFLLNPLTKPYIDSMKRMREVAPNLEKLKKKYKGDKIKFAQAQADLYKQKGINPGAGCIPYLLQIVVLIAFFNVFTRTLTPDGNILERFNELLYPILRFSEGEIINTKFLYLDITTPDKFSILGLPFPIPGPLLILAALTQLVSARITAPYEEAQEKVTQKTKEVTDDMQQAMQKSMTFTFPFITILIGMRFPSGLALYWLIFSLTQAYQQYKSQGWGGLTPVIKKLGFNMRKQND